MTEIEKMFENAGIKTKYKLCCTGCKHIAKLEVINGYPSKWICDKYDEVANCDKAELDYPPFTTDKQLKIIEWFISNSWWLNLKSLDKKLDFSLDFDEKLAKLVNRLWESFSDQEKEEIRGILND